MTGLLGVFPEFTSAVFGGVQETGRQAWEVLRNYRGGATAFFYSARESRIGAAGRALRARTQVETLLVWHCGLLKLAPIIAPTGRRVLFLHGIEAWRRHDILTSALLRRVDLFLSNSDYTWNRFLEFYPECKDTAHRTIPLGIGQPETNVKSPDSIPAAIMLGRMQKGEGYKGHHEVIGAWPMVMKHLPTARLLIAGGGDLRPELELFTGELGLSESVCFQGIIPESEKMKLLQRSRVLALPSRGEGFGLVYLEAMRLARPCLVSGLDAGSEVIHPPVAGLACNPAKQTELAAALIRLLSPGAEWDRMSADARQRYDSFYTERHFQQRLLDALAG